MRALQIPLVYVAFSLFLIGSDVHGRAAASHTPFMNLLEYRRDLLDSKGIAIDRCPMNLRVRPSLRNIVLKDGHNYDWLLTDKNYLPSQRKIDQQWAIALQDSMKEERSKIETQIAIAGSNQSPWVSYKDKNLDRLSGYRYYPGFYPIENFASYQIGAPRMPWGQDRGFTFKVFFEFKSPQKDLTPDLYREFSKKLSVSDFEGDSKIPMLPGWIRFTWNNVIVHATSMASAKVAEKIGLELFANRLASYSRGVDVRDLLNPNEPTDWPHFLCSGDPSKLPSDVSNFVQNK